MSFVNVLKILLPHAILILFVCGYLFLGTIAFRAIETENDVKLSIEKVNKIVAKYDKIATTVENLCHISNLNKKKSWKKKLFAMLSAVSEIHENRPYKVNYVNPNDSIHLVNSRWNIIDGFLYSLSILTTTGYTNVTPLTKTGQIFAIGYGLFGIPLMVLMVVDVGRFLADMILIWYSTFVLWLNTFGTSASAEPKENLNASIKLPKPKLPIWIILGILLLFNVFGGLLYMVQSEPRVNFLQSFFVCFNLMVNLTMGEILVVNDISTILYIVFVVTFGLAVLSMCADLAASELKWLFLKIHYFGRRIKRRMKTYEDLAALAEDEDVESLLRLITEIRKDNPRITNVTPEDILGYIQSKLESTPVSKQSRLRRGATYPFMPEGLDILKYVDAEESEVSSMKKTPSAAAFIVEPIQEDSIEMF